MVNYQDAKIYKLVGGGLTYYGSTCNELRKRFYQHKDKFNGCKSKILFDTGDKVEIVLVEKYPCQDKMELHRRERYYIENNECINKRIPNRTNTEWMKENKENKKNYDIEYYEDNKDKIKEQKKLYYKENIEKVKKWQQQKITCECGLIYTKTNKSRHFKSKKHILFINKKNI